MVKREGSSYIETGKTACVYLSSVIIESFREDYIRFLFHRERKKFNSNSYLKKKDETNRKEERINFT